ncbi:hypothetical protein ETAA8_02070 [Anatilimnocola aggregata]|uniref:Uncharacterized protein n=1 Tax=Anatilimnocola aggregata TaxID=2528021 RepID=A0A517Y4I6_9BACT|nr:hypothetical protein [Anatilimnocola aggregata]QDU25145.1 hypothetical protein ETAA8_02070 [Anatilimnocola aggregata]
MQSRQRQQFRSNFRSLLAVEALEQRAMMAGNVTATVAKGVLVIRGDDAANEIIVGKGPTANSFTITPAAGTTINSLTPALTLTGITKLDIRLNGGNDRLGIGNDVEFVADMLAAVDSYGEEEEPEGGLFDWLAGDEEESSFDIEDPDFSSDDLINLPTRMTGRTYIELGDGDDTLVMTMRTVDTIQIEGGKGNDFILSVLTNATHLVINTDPRKGAGMGDDIAAVVLNTVRGDLAITTGAEDDGVVVLGTTVGNLGVGTGGVISGEITDNDFVMFADVSATDNIGILTEAGDDGVLVQFITGDNLRINTGSGDDQVEITGAALVALAIDTAAGEDSVSLNSGEDGLASFVVRRNLQLYTGADDDEVEIDGGLLNLLVGGVLDIRTGQGDDLLTLYRVVARTASFDGDTGSDEFDIDSLDVANNLTIGMGAGNDILAVRNLSARNAVISGGTGNDVLHDLGLHDIAFTPKLFETIDDGDI